MRSIIYHIVFLIGTFFVSKAYSQYYTSAQINTIHLNKTAVEGDFYLDTINDNYYIGLTNGWVKSILDTQQLSMELKMPQKVFVMSISNGDSDSIQLNPGLDLWIDTSSNSILSRNSQNQNLPGDSNIAIGYQALGNPAGAGSHKVAFGYQAGRNESTLGKAMVTTIGYRAGYTSNGVKTTIFGREAGYFNTGSSVNVFGEYAGYNNKGDSLTAFGYRSGYLNNGNNNLGFGNYTFRNTTGTANHTIAIGYQTLRYDSTAGTAYSVFNGYRAGYRNKARYVTAFGINVAFDNKGENNTFFGVNTGGINTGSNLTAFGHHAGRGNEGINNTALGMYNYRDPFNKANYITSIGQYALRYDSSQGDSYITALGYYSGFQNTGDLITAIGYRVMYQNKGSNLTGIGANSLYYNRGSNSIAFGANSARYNSGKFLNSFGYIAADANKGIHNTVFGAYAYYQSGENNYQTIMGYHASRRDSTIGDAYNTSIGYYAAFTNRGNYLSAIGSNVAYFNKGNYVSGLGYQAAYNNTGDNLIALAYQAGRDNVGRSNIALSLGALRNKEGDGSNIIAIGTYALSYDSSSGNSMTIGLGYYAGHRNEGNQSLFIGGNSGYFNTGDYFTGFGYQVGYQNRGDHNLAIGPYVLDRPIYDVGYSNSIGIYAARYDSSSSIAHNNNIGNYAHYRGKGTYTNSFGYAAGYLNKGDHNNLIGPYTFYDRRRVSNYNNILGYQASRNDSSTIGYNNAVGVNAGYRNTGNYGIMYGTSAGFNNKGDYNILLSANAGYLAYNTTRNISFGFQSGYRSSGVDNIFIGINTGVYTANGDSNIFIGNAAGPNPTSDITNTLYISNGYNVPTLHANLTSKYLGINTQVADNNLSVNGSANKTGGGNWAVFSDKTLKKNIIPFNKGLSEILDINPVDYQFNQKYYSLIGDNDQKKNYTGVIAQEIEEVFPEIISKTEIRGEEYYQVDPSNYTYVLINTIKEQQETLKELQEQLKELKVLVANKKRKSKE